MVTKGILIYDLRSTIYGFGESGARGLFLFEGLNENKRVVNFRFGSLVRGYLHKKRTNNRKE